MPNWIQKLFTPKPQPSAPVSMSAIDYAKLKKEKVDKLVALIAETIALYNATACPCAFPRFRQIVGIDCLDYRAAFCATETEWFIDAVKLFYTRNCWFSK